MKISYLRGDLTSVRTIQLATFLKELTRSQPSKAITELRQMIPYLTTLYRPTDSELIPVINFSSLYKEGEWVAYTGLVLIEFNRLASAEEAIQLRDRLTSFTNPLLAFIGVSGRSVKVVTRYSLPDGTLPASREEALRFHLYAYRKAASHYQHQTGRMVTSREPRLDSGCRISWDSACYYNPDAPVIRMEMPGDLVATVPPLVVQPPAGTGLLAGTLPGLEQRERMKLLFETCLHRVLEEEGDTWEAADPKSFLVRVAYHCCRSGIPEEDTVRWFRWHSHGKESLELIRLTVRNVYRQHNGKPLKPVISGPQKLLRQMEEFLCRRYELRKNVISGQVEFRENHTFCFHFKPVGPEELNGICLEAQQEGIELWDKDIRRYIYSPRVATYNPLQEFFRQLPHWDGKDRIRELARRIPTRNADWPDHFYRWFLGMVAQWMRENKLHGNSLVPVLQGGQGTSKSTFFRMLLPPELREYYTESIRLENMKEAELSMAQHVLINLDEFDRLGRKFQAGLKNLVQLPGLRIKPPHQKSFQRMKRIASFCATANPEELLSDLSGSRRYICVRVEGPIDTNLPVAYEQLYAQAARAINMGEQYWVTPEEEELVVSNNYAFRQRSLLIEYLFIYFRKPEPDETGTFYKALELVDIISHRSRRKFGNISAKMFAAELKAAGIEKKHLRIGNGYELIEL